MIQDAVGSQPALVRSGDSQAALPLPERPDLEQYRKLAKDTPEAADEYDSYIGGVYELLERGTSEESIRGYLRKIEIEAMEMVNGSGQPLLPDANRNTAAAALRELDRYFH